MPPLRAGRVIRSCSQAAFPERHRSYRGLPDRAFCLQRVRHQRAEAYTQQVKLLCSFPFVLWLELVGIWLPILYHSLYGFFIWARGDSNVSDYPWAGNWMYNLQRWTGAFTFAYIVWHTWHLRFSGVHCLPIRTRLSAKYSWSSRTLGHRVLRRGNLLRLLALRLWPVAVRRQVGHHHRRHRPGAVWLRLLAIGVMFMTVGAADHAFVPDYSAATLSSEKARRILCWRDGPGNARSIGNPN